MENNMCFEILGMDIILDHKLKPFLLEVNHAPSFNKDSPIDEYIKKNVLTDTFGLLYKVGYRAKKYYTDSMNKNIFQKTMKNSNISREDKIKEKEKLIRLKDQ